MSGQIRPGWAQQSSGLQASPAQSVTAGGRVLNALNGSPIPRALVSLGGRRVLTDALGRFEFAQFTDQQARLSVTKPGYTQSLDLVESFSGRTVTNISSGMEVGLYPDAIVSGALTGGDGQPLVRVAVSLYRESPNEMSNPTVPAGFTQTDSHGMYRFEAQPGYYRIHLSYAPRMTETGDAMLPLDFPEQNGGERPAIFMVGPGESRQVDLQARTSAAYGVTLRLDTENAGAGLQVICAPSQGGSFMVFAQPSRTRGEYHLDLPSGSYQLHAMLMGRDNQQEALGKVTVAGKPVDGLVMHLAPISQIPVELAVDAGASTSSQSQGSLAPSNSVPKLNQFGLRLRGAGSRDQPGQNDVMLFARSDRPTAFQAASGSYRLQGQQSGDWYIRSASYGSSDLLSEKLVVAPGAGGETIRVVVSNLTGQVSGTLLVDGQSASGMVYVISHEPNLNPVRSLHVSNGAYKVTLPIGTYTVVAFARAFAGDLTNPAVTAKLNGAQTVEVTAGGSATADVTAQPQGELP